MAVCTVIPLLVLLTYCAQGNGFTLWDALHSDGSKCGADGRVYGSNFSTPEEMWYDTGAPCSCSPLCAHYKDCCLDSEYYVAEEQRWGESPPTCTDLSNSNGSFHMKNSCPVDWSDDETRTNCETDIVAPLTSHRTNISYRNAHCAVCNGDFDRNTDILWLITFSCSDILSDYYRIYIEYQNRAYIQITIYDTEHSKHLKYSIPARKLCDLNLCPGAPGWLYDLLTITQYEPHSNEDFILKLQDYTSQIHNSTSFPTTGISYKCTMSPHSFNPNIMSICLPDLISTCAPDLEDSEVEAKCLAYTDYYCDGHDVYRNPHCAYCNHVDLYETIHCQFFPSIKQPETIDFDKIFFISNPRNTKSRVNAKQSYRDQPNTTSTEYTDFVHNRNSTVESHDFFLENITVVCIGLSIICLVLHLAIFVVTPRLRNLQDVNLASLCVALLLLYASLIEGVFMEPPCTELAVTTHYSFLATICWMLTISFDVWRTIRWSARNLRLSSGSKWKRFGAYSGCCWTFPALIVTSALHIEFSDLDTSFRPGYGLHNCWFSNAASLLVFVVAPLCVVMALNVVFFSWSAFLIYSTKSKIENKSTARADFLLYIQLALIMGLTWITGIIAGVVNLKAVWYVFVVLNTLQSLFIFVAYSCIKDVWLELEKDIRQPVCHFYNCGF